MTTKNFENIINIKIKRYNASSNFIEPRPNFSRLNSPHILIF